MKLRWQWPLWLRKGGFSLLSEVDGSRALAGSAPAPAAATEYSTRHAAAGAATVLGPSSGVRPLPRPAIRWVGPGGRIALRPFDFAADADAVCAFQEETYTSNFPDFHYTNSFANAFRHDLRRASLDPQHGLFVFDEGSISGFLWLVICENTWTRERYGYINNVYVVPARRGNGLARELMQQTDAFFRSRGIQRVRLTVTAANTAASRLYQRSGYAVTRWEMEKDL